jgi:hypothetical protein
MDSYPYGWDGPSGVGDSAVETVWLIRHPTCADTTGNIVFWVPRFHYQAEIDWEGIVAKLEHSLMVIRKDNIVTMFSSQ